MTDSLTAPQRSNTSRFGRCPTLGALRLIEGIDDKPFHPPLTDVAIGGYSIGVLMLILGALDVQKHQMAHGALLAISGGIIFGLLAVVTGLLDWLGLPSGRQVRRLATTHVPIMWTATVLFVLTWLIQRPGYDHRPRSRPAVGSSGWQRRSCCSSAVIPAARPDPQMESGCRTPLDPLAQEATYDRKQLRCPCRAPGRRTPV